MKTKQGLYRVVNDLCFKCGGVVWRPENSNDYDWVCCKGCYDDYRPRPTPFAMLRNTWCPECVYYRECCMGREKDED
jgi:hypothetical protein